MAKANEAAQVQRECEKCAEHYERSPRHAGPDTMIDLYRTIARLARIIERQQNQLDHLIPDKSSDV